VPAQDHPTSGLEPVRDPGPHPPTADTRSGRGVAEFRVTSPASIRDVIAAGGLRDKLDLACDTSATALAVAYATHVLRTWGLPRSLTADALLIVDELVTNAVRHGRAAAAPPGPDGPDGPEAPDETDRTEAPDETDRTGAPGGTDGPDGFGRGRAEVGGCGLELRACCGHLVICVHDDADQVPVLREVSLDAEDGRGLQIVAGLSEGAWGYAVQPSQPGKRVWARCALKTTDCIPG
jgi:hypothetical protein